MDDWDWVVWVGLEVSLTVWLDDWDFVGILEEVDDCDWVVWLMVLGLDDWDCDTEISVSQSVSEISEEVEDWDWVVLS